MEVFRSLSCRECLEGAGLSFDFTMAFQPIVELGAAEPLGYEALVRGVNGEGAAQVLGLVNDATWSSPATCTRTTSSARSSPAS